MMFPIRFVVYLFSEDTQHIMAAEFKSHVLMRDEKGALGIPFKRLLLAGVSGGFMYTVLRLGIPGWAVPGGAVCAVLVLVLTGMRGGLPL